MSCEIDDDAEDPTIDWVLDCAGDAVVRFGLNVLIIDPWNELEHHRRRDESLAAPAPGMVAARRGHVFVLKRHLHGNTWLVHDSNSGHGKTRIHPRSIAGFTIVDPRAGT
ncbi:hypothetical protein [Nitrobacter winogradskyi]|nr:hypothetical protein [Nitrobacter winogradskyi]